MFILERGSKEGRETKGYRETEREKKTLMGWPPAHARTRDQTHNLGMCPDWESNPQPFGARGNASTESPGQG